MGCVMNEGTEPHDGSIDPDDDESSAVIAALGRQLKLRREHAGLRHKEFGAALGYGEDLVYKVEGGKRIPRPEYLDKADEVLGAGGRIAAMKQDVEQARYPKKVRDLAKPEAAAVELGAYANHNMHGLLQTEE
jgi:transcriptional regulator with XRE-family HTH domain